jgi:hypothetical protein
MSIYRPTQAPGDKLKKALTCFSELLESHPEKSRSALLQEMMIKFDLTPAECEFIHKQFSCDDAE